MTYTSNPQLEQAFDYVQNTNQNIFLTGKAGTGKTTFLHRIKKTCTKRMAVVAPTGVAAINAKGVTIHSLFQLPFGLFLPGLKREMNRQRKFSKKKINLIKSLDLLIIDEISMVRADILDAIDDVLRRYKNFHQPFGGLQLLMIGDLHQLPPVVKNKEWNLLKQHYTSPYFFDSNALKKTNPITIQLTHIYRQSDAVFIQLLNKVRDNQLDQSVLDTLNARYIEGFIPKENEGYITLTALNRTAQAINEEKLITLKGRKHQFKAKITGEFPASTFPTEELLEFKIGAQVLFIKNDTSPEKRYYNGKIGQITDITTDYIYVKCPNEHKPIPVTRVEWINRKYSLSERTKEIIEEEKGTFTQYPLKLAWAITIHKSQGLTFEKAIIDAQAAFAHGQVYVALSRCKSFEGIVLRSPIRYASVKTDGLVKDYSDKAEQNPPDEAHLFQSKLKYQQTLIRELFNFKTIRVALNKVTRIYLEHQNFLTKEASNQVRTLESKIEGSLFATSAKFEPILNDYFVENKLPEEHEILIERIKKAGQFFTIKIKKELQPELLAVPVFADNQEIKSAALEAIKATEKELFIKHRCFLEAQKNTFNAQRYLQTKANAELDFEKVSRTGSTKVPLKIPQSVTYPKLYEQLYYWRTATATELGLKPHEIIPTVTLIELAKSRPTNKASLQKVKGFGVVKLKQHGIAIMKLIDEFCAANSISSYSLATTSSGSKENKTYTVEKIRETHPKAYQPWTESDEKVLFQLKAEGKTISYIAGILGRNKGAITSRLKKFDNNQALVVFS